MILTINNSQVSMAEAVEAVILPDTTGELERLRSVIDQQGQLIARMLNVLYDTYDDHFTSRDYTPRTEADKLAFILGHPVRVSYDPTA